MRLAARPWLPLLALLLLGGAAPGEETSADSHSSASAEAVVVDGCRVKLIDAVTLAAGRTGILATVVPREGDTVNKGDVVVTLEDGVLRASLAAAEKQAANGIEIRYARKATELAYVEWKKAQQTNTDVPGTVPEIEVRRLRLAAERGLLQIEQAEHQFVIDGLKRDEASETLKTFRLHAPFSGIVTAVHKSPGEAVREGEPVLELVSTARVRVEGYVPFAEACTLRRGNRVEVQIDIADIEHEIEQRRFGGELIFVDVKVEPVTGDVRVWAEVQNEDNALRDGLTARMSIFPTPAPRALPQTARKPRNEKRQ